MSSRGLTGKQILILIAVALGTSLVTSVVMREERQNESAGPLRVNTLARLARWAELLKEYRAFNLAPPSTAKLPGGRGTIDVVIGDITRIRIVNSNRFESLERAGALPVVDAWGQPFVYRAPGPIHTHGWDLYSMGPDGSDDRGLGDDLCVGEDMAPGPGGG